MKKARVQKAHATVPLKTCKEGGGWNTMDVLWRWKGRNAAGGIEGDEEDN